MRVWLLFNLFKKLRRLKLCNFAESFGPAFESRIEKSLVAVEAPVWPLQRDRQPHSLTQRFRPPMYFRSSYGLAAADWTLPILGIVQHDPAIRENTRSFGCSVRLNSVALLLKCDVRFLAGVIACGAREDYGRSPDVSEDIPILWG
jgi:hypothetical protein